MDYISKTYRFDSEVVEALERAKLGGTSPNQFLRQLMGLTSKPAENPHLAAVAAQIARSEAAEDHRPKNCQCKHCGATFAGVRYASICPTCKSVGHTLAPSDCPVCNEAQAC